MESNNNIHDAANSNRTWTGRLVRHMTRVQQASEGICLFTGIILIVILFSLHMFHVNLQRSETCVHQLIQKLPENATWDILEVRIASVWTKLGDEIYKELLNDYMQQKTAATATTNNSTNDTNDTNDNNTNNNDTTTILEIANITDPVVIVEEPAAANNDTLITEINNNTDESPWRDSFETLFVDTVSVAMTVATQKFFEYVDDTQLDSWQKNMLLDKWKSTAQEFEQSLRTKKLDDNQNELEHYLRLMKQVHEEELAAIEAARRESVLISADLEFLLDPIYQFSKEHGFLTLSESASKSHNVTVMKTTLSAKNPCLGKGFLSLIIELFIGHETILRNQFARYFRRGCVKSVRTYEIVEFRPAALSSSLFFGTWDGFLYHKLSLLMTINLIVFATTSLVSFVLRETYVRLLKFTMQLQYHMRNGLQMRSVILLHTLDALYFVPIIVGVLMFMFQLFDDYILAFLVFSLLWVCEIFCVLRVRNNLNPIVHYFPKFVLAYFVLFLLYVFSFPFPFTYVAFAAFFAFAHHAMFYLCNNTRGGESASTVLANGMVNEMVITTAAAAVAALATANLQRVVQRQREEEMGRIREEEMGRMREEEMGRMREQLQQQRQQQQEQPPQEEEEENPPQQDLDPIAVTVSDTPALDDTPTLDDTPILDDNNADAELRQRQHFDYYAF